MRPSWLLALSGVNSGCSAEVEKKVPNGERVGVVSGCPNASALNTPEPGASASAAVGVTVSRYCRAGSSAAEIWNVALQGEEG